VRGLNLRGRREARLGPRRGARRSFWAPRRANVDFGGRLDFFWFVEPLLGPLGQPWTRGRKSKTSQHHS
jgi:hypothetical protein